MKLNINMECTVVLTGYGAEILEREVAKLPIDLRPDTRYKAGVTHKDQLWQLMQTFGPHIFNGGPPPFEGCIIEIAGDASNHFAPDAQTSDSGRG